MQRKKYGKIVLGVVCFALLLAGCAKQKAGMEAGERQDQDVFRPMINLTETDEGVYYVQNVQADSDFMALKYVDKVSAKETVLCRKVNCRHDSKACQAVSEGANYMGFLMYVNESLYYMVCKSVGEDRGLCLYRIRKDGTDKTLVHRFENQTIPPNAAVMYRGKLFLSLPTMVEFEDATGSESAEPSLVMYDLQTEEETLIVDGSKLKDTYVVPCGGSGDSIYFLEMNLNEDEGLIFRQYDFQTKEIRTVLEGVLNDAQFIWDDTIYLQPAQKKNVEAYHIKTKKREEILTYEEEIDDVYIQIGYMELIKRTKEDGKERGYYKWYDLKEGRYLFDEFESEDEMYVRMRLANGDYWIEKDDGIYFYHLKEGTWTKVEEIS